MEDGKKAGATWEPELEEAVFATLVNEHRAQGKNEDEYRARKKREDEEEYTAREKSGNKEGYRTHEKREDEEDYTTREKSGNEEGHRAQEKDENENENSVAEQVKIPLNRRMDRRGRRTIRKYFRKQRIAAFFDGAYPAMRRAVAVVLLLVVMGMSSSAYAPQPRENIYNFITFYSDYEFVVEYEPSSISTATVSNVTAGWLPEGMEEAFAYYKAQYTNGRYGTIRWDGADETDPRMIFLKVYMDSTSKQYTYNTASNGERGDMVLSDGTIVHWWSYERKIGSGNVYVNMIWYDKEHDAIFDISGQYVTYEEMLQVVEELIVK